MIPRVAHAAVPGGVPASVPKGVAATARASPGLTLPPQAVTARPAVRMLRAAFTSRSWAAAHAEQVQTRTLRPACPVGPVLAPHAEHCCEDGYHRSMWTTVRPYRSAL